MFTVVNKQVSSKQEHFQDLRIWSQKIMSQHRQRHFWHILLSACKKFFLFAWLFCPVKSFPEHYWFVKTAGEIREGRESALNSPSKKPIFACFSSFVSLLWLTWQGSFLSFPYTSNFLDRRARISPFPLEIWRKNLNPQFIRQRTKQTIYLRNVACFKPFRSELPNLRPRRHPSLPLLLCWWSRRRKYARAKFSQTFFITHRNIPSSSPNKEEKERLVLFQGRANK